MYYLAAGLHFQQHVQVYGNVWGLHHETEPGAHPRTAGSHHVLLRSLRQQLHPHLHTHTRQQINARSKRSYIYKERKVRLIQIKEQISVFFTFSFPQSNFSFFSPTRKCGWHNKPFESAQGFPRCSPGCRTGRCAGACLAGSGWSTSHSSEEQTKNTGKSCLMSIILHQYPSALSQLYLIGFRQQCKKGFQCCASHWWYGVSQEGPDSRDQDC